MVKTNTTVASTMQNAWSYRQDSAVSECGHFTIILDKGFPE